MAVGGSTDGNVGTNRGRITVYNTADFSVVGNEIRGANDGENIGFTVDISNAGDRVFAACSDFRSRVYHYNTGTSLWDLEYTTPFAGGISDYGRSVRCNSAGTIFFVTLVLLPGH